MFLHTIHTRHIANIVSVSNPERYGNNAWRDSGSSVAGADTRSDAA